MAKAIIVGSSLVDHQQSWKAFVHGVSRQGIVSVSELHSIIICGCLWDGRRLESGTLTSKSGFEGKSCESCHLLEQMESQGMREDI